MFINPSARSRVAPTSPPLPDLRHDFHSLLPDYKVTPLVSLPHVAQELGLRHVFMKDESHRLGLPAFKILGASWAIYKAVAEKCRLQLNTPLAELGPAAQAQGLKLVTCTEGNWGRATARMAKYLHIPAVVFVPNFMNEETQAKIASEGANVIVVEGDYDDSIKAARKEAESANALLVMDTVSLQKSVDSLGSPYLRDTTKSLTTRQHHTTCGSSAL
jgi:diaminopropionate ammonia-lyase